MRGLARDCLRLEMFPEFTRLRISLAAEGTQEAVYLPQKLYLSPRLSPFLDPS